MFNKLLGDVRGIFNIITIIELVISTIFILMGLVFFSSPNMSTIAASIFTGLLLIGNGISKIYAYIKKGDIVLFNNDMIYGFILIIIGIVSLFLGNILSIIFGIYFIISGVQKMNYSMFLKKFNEASWLLTLVVGIIFIAIGIVSFFTSKDAVVEVVGICLFGFGVINFINVLLLRRRSRYFIA